jgi:hypothetical protein
MPTLAERRYNKKRPRNHIPRALRIFDYLSKQPH